MNVWLDCVKTRENNRTQLEPSTNVLASLIPLFYSGHLVEVWTAGCSISFEKLPICANSIISS